MKTGATETIHRPSRRMTDLVRHFRRDEDGSVIVFTLFILTLMLIISGMAVDFMRFESRRSQLQGVTDRAVLAAASLKQTQDPAAVVRDHFDKAGMLQYLDGAPQVGGNASNRSVTAKGKLELDTFFLKLIGMDTMTASSASTAVEGIGRIEVSLVVDISGSMENSIPGSSETRIEKLEDAAKAFVDKLLVSENADKISISLVPYSEHVNAGPELFDELNVDETHGFSHCIEFPASEYSSTDFDNTITYEQVPHFQWNPSYNSSGYRVPDVTEPICPHNTYETIVPLTQNKTLLTQRIEALTPRAGTVIFVGLKWGVALLDPTMRPILAGLPATMKDPAFADRPAKHITEDATSDTLKYVVLMTDGENQPSERLKPENYDSPSERYHWSLENWPYYRATDLRNPSYSQWMDPKYTNTLGNTYMQSICSAAKNKGIVIYTIAMGATTNGKTEMENCASTKAGHYFETSGSELVQIFEDIADQITDLRLTL